MKKLTVLAAALAAGLTSFAANSAPHPSKSLRDDGSETAPVAKTQDKATAKNEKQATKTTKAEARRPEKTRAKAETAQPNKARAKAEIVKTPLFTVTRAATENGQAAEKSEPKRQRVAEKRAPKKERTAEKRSPERKRVAEKTAKKEQVAEKRTRRQQAVAEKKAPKREQIAEKKAPKREQVARKDPPKQEHVAVTPIPKPQEPGDRQVAVKEPVALDLVQTASLGSKGVKTMKSAGGQYREIIAKYAASYGVPVSLAHAVIQVESNYRVNAKGSAGEIGLMQIKPSTARMMGYSGSAQGLFHPETNIKFGMKYLAKAQELGGGTTCGTILKYNAGHGAKRMNPVSSAYCVKVKRFLGV
jgi:soluble lytic murein transglycosylase-like protein